MQTGYIKSGFLIPYHELKLISFRVIKYVLMLENQCELSNKVLFFIKNMIEYRLKR